MTILRYHIPPSWIECSTKTRLDGPIISHVALSNMAESSSSAAWSKSLKNIPYFDSSFIEKWLEKDGKVPKKVISRGYSNFCEGYIFDVEGKFQSRRVVVFSRRVMRVTISAFLIIVQCIFLRSCVYLKIEIPCDLSHSVLNFHIHNLLLVKPQDAAEVLVRAKSYKSQRKNEEPWRVQVITVPSCLI